MKFFIDNNISPRVARALACLAESKHEVIHLKDKFKPDTPDEEWMRKLAEEKEWVIMSGDSNISRNPYEVRAWQSAGHTIFFLQPSWMHQQLFEQASKLFHLFPEVEKKAPKARRGSAFKMPFRGKIEELS